MSEQIDKIIDIDGKKKYGIITMVINDNKYLSPAIVLAESVRKSGNISDLVVMIDDKITKDSEEILKNFYDKIIKIKPIKIKHEDKSQQIILTKLESLRLEEYKKILLIDTDTIIFKTIDEQIIKTNTPSGVYINDKLNYGILLLEPNKKKYKQMKKIIKEDKEQIEKAEKPLEIVMEKIYNDNINNLDLKIGTNEYKEDNDGIQYSKDKPFLMTSDKSIQERMHLNHFKIWFIYLLNIITRYPELKVNINMKEPIDISKYFLSHIGRFIYDQSRISRSNKKKAIKNLYGKNIDRNLDYYHLDISKEYSNDNLINILDNTSIVGFINYINKKSQIKSLSNTITYADINDILSQIQDDMMLDYILGEYIKLYSNVFVLLFIEKKDNKELINTPIDIKSNLIYKKTLQMPGIILRNILFNIYQKDVYSERLISLSSYEDYSIYNIKVEIYQTLYPINMLTSNINNQIFIINDTNTKIRLGSILFNSNTLSRFNDNKLKWINKTKSNEITINRKNIKKILKFQSIKKWIINNWTSEQMDNLIVIDQKDGIIKLLDNNFNKLSIIKKITDSKIELVDIIWAKSSQFKNILKKYSNILEQMYNPKYYWELEGIKFYDK